MLQAFVDLKPALFVDEMAHFVTPVVLQRLRPDDTAVVVVLQRLPQRGAILHAVRPRHAVEPQQQFLGAGFYIVIGVRDVTLILAHGIGAGLGGAVEAYAVLRSLMIVYGTPLQGIVGLEAVGLRTVVVVELEDVVQTQRHHVVDAGFAAGFHPDGHVVDELPVSAKGLCQPLLGDVYRQQLRIPRQSAKGIPVGLREMMTAPVRIIADVGHTSDAF